MDYEKYMFQKPVIVTDEIAQLKGYEQARHHRKKRIDKKWRKRYGTKPVYDMNTVMEWEVRIYMTNEVYKELVSSAIMPKCQN